MQTFIGFVRDLGWGITIGIVVLLLGGAFFYFEHRGKTKKEKPERRAQDAARAETPDPNR